MINVFYNYYQPQVFENVSTGVRKCVFLQLFEKKNEDKLIKKLKNILKN